MKKQVKKAVAAGKEKKGLDKFGSREGSNAAKINAALSKKPKKMKQLTSEAKVSGTHYDHLKHLIEDGFIKKSEKGFALV